MTLELIAFIASILFGILLYWRESTGNGFYRFFNKMMYSKELQMKPTEKRGFLYEQKFILRLVFITFLFLIGIIIARFLIPIDIYTISIFASCIVGTLIGSYIGGFILKSEKVIDEQSDSLEDKIQDTIQKGKEVIGDFTAREPKVVHEAKEEIKEEPDPDKKSARERLKDKGLL